MKITQKQPKKTPNSTEIGAVDNSVLPKCGVETLIVLLYFFCRICFFVSHFFCNLVQRKKQLLSEVFS